MRPLTVAGITASTARDDATLKLVVSKPHDGFRPVKIVLTLNPGPGRTTLLVAPSIVSPGRLVAEPPVICHIHVKNMIGKLVARPVLIVGKHEWLTLQVHGGGWPRKIDWQFSPGIRAIRWSPHRRAVEVSAERIGEGSCRVVVTDNEGNKLIVKKPLAMHRRWEIATTDRISDPVWKRLGIQPLHIDGGSAEHNILETVGCYHPLPTVHYLRGDNIWRGSQRGQKFHYRYDRLLVTGGGIRKIARLLHMKRFGVASRIHVIGLHITWPDVKKGVVVINGAAEHKPQIEKSIRRQVAAGRGEIPGDYFIYAQVGIGLKYRSAVGNIQIYEAPVLRVTDGTWRRWTTRGLASRGWWVRQKQVSYAVELY